MTHPAIIAQSGFDPYADARDAGWFGSDIAKGIGKVAKATANFAVKKVAPAIVKQALPAAQLILKNAGPIGMAANAGVEAMKAGLAGKNIAQIALAAAHGATPTAIDVALTAGQRLARGDNVLATAVQAGAHTLLSGSAERFAYSVAADALKKGATKGDLGVARRALVTEGQRRAFDAAVGVVAHAAKGKPMVPLSLAGPFKKKTAARPMSAPRPGRPVVNLAPRRAAPFAVKGHAIAKGARVNWKRLSPRAAAFIKSRVPHAPHAALVGRDTGTLAGGVVSSTMPTVRNGSAGAAVSTLQATLNQKRGAGLVVDGKFGAKTSAAVISFQKASGLVADGIVGQKTWGALDAAPSPAVPLPAKPVVSSVVRPTLRSGARGSAVQEAQTLLNLKSGAGLKVDGIFGSATLAATKSFQRSKDLQVDGVIGPKTWGALDAAPILVRPSTSPEPVTIPSILSNAPTPAPIPTIGESAADTSSVLQAKAILVAWAKTDGVTEPGFPDYGQRAEDMSTTFGTRDKFVGSSFARWNNRTQGTTLPTSGELSPALATALRTWAEKRAAVAIALPPTVKPPSSLPATFPALPPAGGSASPGLPALPASPFPVTATDQNGQTVVTLPTDIVNGSAPAGSTPAPAAEKASPIVMVGGGAVLGGLIGGPIGAVIGAAAGAIASA